MNTLLFAKIADGIWIGNSVATENVLCCKDIHSIIRLDNIPGDFCEIYNYAISSEELLDMEIPTVVKKLNKICDIICDLKSAHKNILIQCADGKNKSLLVAGYFLKKCGKMNAHTVLTKCRTIYFTDEQRGEEILDQERAQKIKRGEHIMPPSPEDIERMEVRKNLRCLNNRSYRKIIADY